MVEDRLKNIEQSLDDLHHGASSMGVRLESIETSLNGLRSSTNERFERVDDRLEELNRHMRVLHEDVKSDVRALAESLVAFEERVDRRFDAMSADNARHLTVLQDILRFHSRTLGDHEGRIKTLEGGTAR